MSHWLLKTDPETYSWDDFAKEKRTSWDGIRNYAARNYLKGMKKGDAVLIYHSGGESEIIGLGTVTREFYPDPTAEDDTWCSVEITAGKKLARGIPLAEIKKTASLRDMLLIKISRLSVMPVTKKEYDTILALAAGND